MSNAPILWEASEYGKPFSEKVNNASERLMKESSALSFGFAGQRARVPPDPIPNSEVKPCSVPSCSVVFGHVNLGKLAANFGASEAWRYLPKLYNQVMIVLGDVVE